MCEVPGALAIALTRGNRTADFGTVEGIICSPGSRSKVVIIAPRDDQHDPPGPSLASPAGSSHALSLDYHHVPGSGWNGWNAGLKKFTSQTPLWRNNKPMNLVVKSIRIPTMWAAMALSPGAVGSALAQDPDGGGASQPACNCLATEPLAKQSLRPLAGVNPPVIKAPGTVLQRYPFLPMGGILGNDLGINNLVDLNPAASAILDVFGGGATYDGHGGHDIDLISFTEQDLGVPVFAALDGTVSSVHDGEYDRQVVNNSAPGNYVILNHGNNHYSWYWHLRKNSVLVTLNQVVKAGQQLGLVGSSGNSSGPHLHFETQVDGGVVEPFTGPSRPSQSLWLNQPVFPAPVALRRIFLTDVDLSTWDGKQPIGTKAVWTTGSKVIYLPISLINGPKVGSTCQFRFIRPNGSTPYDSGLHTWSAEYRSSWWWWSRTVNLNVEGVWRLDFLINGSVVAAVPFTVNAAGTLANRAPVSQPIGFEKSAYAPGEVVVCQATTANLVADPDFTAVRYQWVWKKNGTAVRSITHGGRMDAIPRSTGVAGDVITCEVTVSDGALTSSTTSATVTLYEAYSLWSAAKGTAAATFSTDQDGDGLPAVAEYWLGTSPTVRNSALTAQRQAGGPLSMNLPRVGLDPNITAIVYTSTNLIDWVAANPNADGTVWTAGSASDKKRWMRVRFGQGAAGPSATVTVGEVKP